MAIVERCNVKKFFAILIAVTALGFAGCRYSRANVGGEADGDVTFPVVEEWWK